MHRPFAGWTGLALLLPALLMVGLLFVYPFGFSLAYAFRNEQTGGWDLTNFAKAFDLYGRDIALTAGVTVLSTALVGVLAIAIAGYITLGENPRAVKALRWIYRWPLFIPFVVAAQLMRTFLAKNGMLNNTLMSLDLVEPLQAISLLDWRGVVITFVWKQLPFAALLISGAMAAMDRSLMESARGLGAGRLRILIEIVLPQVQATVWVSLILSFVVRVVGPHDDHCRLADVVDRRHGLARQLLWGLRCGQCPRFRVFRHERACGMVLPASGHA